MPGRNYQSSLHFPYGYQGQEKDAETGLTNFELRQYDGRIGRWYNPDPYMQHHSPYLAMSNNPVSSTDPDGGWDGEMNGESANSNANYFISIAESTKGKLYGELSQLERKFVANYNHTTYQQQFEDRIMDNVDAFGSYSERGKDYYYSEKRGLYGYWADYVEKTSFRSGKVGGGHDGKAFEAATLGTNVGWKFNRIGSDEFNTNLRLKLQLQNNLMSGLKMVEGFNPASNAWDATSMLIYGTDKYGNEGNATVFAYAALGAIPGGNIETGITREAVDAAKVLSKSDLLRIENAASRINKPITVVGSRASGKAGAFSDWDYVIGNLSNKEWKKIKNSLPGSKSVLDNTSRNIDIFTGKVNTNSPYITIYPR